MTEQLIKEKYEKYLKLNYGDKKALIAKLEFQLPRYRKLDSKTALDRVVLFEGILKLIKED